MREPCAEIVAVAQAPCGQRDAYVHYSSERVFTVAIVEGKNVSAPCLQRMALELFVLRASTAPRQLVQKCAILKGSCAGKLDARRSHAYAVCSDVV